MMEPKPPVDLVSATRVQQVPADAPTDPEKNQHKQATTYSAETMELSLKLPPAPEVGPAPEILLPEEENPTAPQSPDVALLQ